MLKYLIYIQILSYCLNESNAEEPVFPYDIYGDASKFDPSHSITVDDSCQYTATLKVNLPKGNLPRPTRPESCTPDTLDCDGENCLMDVRNVYRFSNTFKEVTGFKHIGIEYSPCGHPPLEKFGRTHVNFHIFRIEPEEREKEVCEMINPWICKFPQNGTQTTVTGRNYFQVTYDVTTGGVTNTPEKSIVH